MTRIALYTKHTKIADAIARDYFIPGCDKEDLRQEARVALWIATEKYDPARGKFPTFAHLVIRRHLISLLRVTTKCGRAPRWVELAEGHATSIPYERFHRLIDAFEKLTLKERRTVARILNEEPLANKSDDNARYAVRKKLRSAA